MGDLSSTRRAMAASTQASLEAIEQAQAGLAPDADTSVAPPLPAAVSSTAAVGADTGAASSSGKDAAGFSRSVDRGQFLKLCTVVMLPMFLSALDQTMLAAAMPVISREFSGLQDSSWLAVSYLLASIVVVPLYGQLGDQHGRRRTLLGAITVFFVGSVLCGIAPTFGFLVASRAIQGLGGGGLMTISHALIGEVVPPRERPRYQAYFAIVFMVSSIGGPLVGGLVVQHADWRWLFYGNLPLCLLAVWRLWGILPEDVIHHRPGRLHLFGALLFMAAVSLSLFWLSSAGHRFGWLSATSGGLLALIGLLWYVLIRAERRVERSFLPIDLLPNRTMRFASLSVVCFASTMFAMIFYLPMYCQIVLEAGVAESGALLLPITLGVVSGAMLSSRLMLWTGRPKLVPVGGLSFAAICLLLLTVAPANRVVLMGLSYFIGIGVGCVMSVMQIVTQLAVGPTRLGAASATLALARSLGAAVGASAFGALLFALIDTDNALNAAADPAMREQVQFAFHVAFIGAACVCITGALMAIQVPAVRLDKRAVLPRADALAE